MQNFAKTALQLIDAASPGVGAYTDQNLAAVATCKQWLRKIATGELVVSEPPPQEKGNDA